MNFNIKNIKILMAEKSNNNYHRFAEMLEVDVSQLHRLLNGKGGGGAKILKAIFDYCKSNNLEVEDYIF